MSTAFPLLYRREAAKTPACELLCIQGFVVLVLMVVLSGYWGFVLGCCGWVVVVTLYLV